LKNLILIFLLCASVTGQKNGVAKAKAAPRAIPTFEVKFEPDPKLSVPYQEGAHSAVFSGGCDAEGNPYVQVDKLIPNSIQVLEFGPHEIVTFETSKISDVVEPKFIAEFVPDSGLYILIEGDTHTEQHTKKLEDGQDEVSWETKGDPRYYIARFDADGSYKSALKVDLPFHPKLLAGFESGNFLTAGFDESKIWRVALLDSAGQLLRYIEFPNEKQEPVEKTFAHSFGDTASPEVSAWMFSMFVSFFPYQDRILYIRGRSGAPIYEIRDGGETRTVKIKALGGYAVDYILPSDRNWFVVSTEFGKFTDAKSVVYEVNPSNGELLRQFLAEGSGRGKTVSEGQSDLVCVHEGEFTAVRHQDGKLTILHGTPVPAKTNATEN
jgi:hypothetical protein